MRLAILLVVASCDPIWNASVRLRDPANRPIEGATVAVACREDNAPREAHRTDTAGAATVGSMGNQFPPGCDVYIAKPGYQTQRIRYRDLCPQGPDDCERVFDFDLMLEPE